MLLQTENRVIHQKRESNKREKRRINLDRERKRDRESGVAGKVRSGN